MPPLPDGPRVRALARTYGPDAVDRVDEYRRVLAHCADHPEQGSSAVAGTIGLPRGRIRSWVDGDGQPDPVRAIRRVADRGWFDARPGSPAFSALLRCHAWILAGGHIASDTYAPSFSVHTEDPEPVIREALAVLGLRARTDRQEDAGRATEVRPRDEGVLLGRFLAGVLDAPCGTKNDGGPTDVPCWVRNAAEPVRREWAAVYLALRAVDRPGRGGAIQVNERRSRRYRESLRDLLRSLVDDPECVRCYGKSTVFVGPLAVEDLRTAPRPIERQSPEPGTVAAD
jgi:plasmid stabilization system protein ParE